MSIRVLVVEDSPVVSEFLNHILGSDPSIRVVGTVRNGLEALRAVEKLQPDIVTMDISMPVMDGYEATRRIMETHPLPIVIVSVNVDSKELATTFRALEAGALAAVQKPAGVGHPDHEETARTLVRTVKLMSEVKVVRRWPKQGREPISPARAAVAAPRTFPAGVDVVAMGASTGGPAALLTILSALPGDFRSPILVVQHIAPGFIQGFAESITSYGKLPARVAENGEALRPGHIYLAPDNVHMGLTVEGRVKLVDEPPISSIRPSVSYLFRSVADIFGTRSAGVLLTGMGKDGAEGLKYMKERGAVTIAQNEESCVVFGMPGEAIRLGAADHVLSPEQIVPALIGLLGAKSIHW